MVEFQLTITKPVRDRETEAEETFDLIVSDGGMRTCGFDIMFEYYPALSDISLRVLSFASDPSSANREFKPDAMSVDFTMGFANSDFISAPETLILDRERNYFLFAVVDRLASENGNLMFYRLKAGDSAHRYGPKALQVEICVDKGAPLTLGRKYVFSVRIFKILPFKIVFTCLNGDAADDPDAPSAYGLKVEDVMRLAKARDDGMTLVIEDGDRVRKAVLDNLARQPGFPVA